MYNQTLEEPRQKSAELAERKRHASAANMFCLTVTDVQRNFNGDSCLPCQLTCWDIRSARRLTRLTLAPTLLHFCPESEKGKQERARGLRGNIRINNSHESRKTQ